MIVPRYAREIPRRFRLVAGKCSGCGHVSFPARRVCPECGSEKAGTIQLSPRGKVLSYTVIHVAADDFSVETPFPVAIIETPEGGRLTAQVVDCDPDEVKIGTTVELVFRKIRKEGSAGILQYGYKAVLDRT